MSYESLASQIASDIIARSGVGLDQWTPDRTAQVAYAASSMAAQILYGTGLSMPNAIYEKTGTPIIFGSEVGDDVAWSTESIADGAGRQSALHDQGADGVARPVAWRYRIYTQAQATPTVGNTLQLHLKTSDGTHPDNDDGAGDAAVSAENKLNNLLPLLPAIVDEAAANVEFVSTGIVSVSQRHFGVVLWNSMGSAVTADAAETKAVFTPIYDEIQ